MNKLKEIKGSIQFLRYVAIDYEVEDQYIAYDCDICYSCKTSEDGLGELQTKNYKLPKFY